MGWFSDILKVYPDLAQEVERLRILDEKNRKKKKHNDEVSVEPDSEQQRD